MARVIEKVVLSTTQPEQANVVWAKPDVNGKITFKVPVTDNTYRNVSVEELIDYDIVQLSNDVKELKERELEVKKEVKDGSIFYKLYYDDTFVSDIEIPFDKVIESTDYNTETNVLTIKIANTEDVVTIDFNKIFEDLFQTSALYIDPNEYTREQLIALAGQNKLIPGKKYICTDIVIGQECESSDDIVINEKTGNITVNNLKDIYAKVLIEYIGNNAGGFPLDFNPIVSVIKDSNSDYIALTPAVDGITLEYNIYKNELKKFRCGTFEMGTNNIILRPEGYSFLKTDGGLDQSNVSIGSNNIIIIAEQVLIYSFIGNNNNIRCYVHGCSIGNDNNINMIFMNYSNIGNCNTILIDKDNQNSSSYLQMSIIGNSNNIKGTGYIDKCSIGNSNNITFTRYIASSYITVDSSVSASLIDLVVMNPNSHISVTGTAEVRYFNIEMESSLIVNGSINRYGYPNAIIKGTVTMDDDFPSYILSYSTIIESTDLTSKSEDYYYKISRFMGTIRYTRLEIVRGIYKVLCDNGELVINSDFA